MRGSVFRKGISPVEMLVDYFKRVAGYEKWVVGIELLLIGLVVYWAVDFLEGTRGERLFRGVLFILIAGLLILNLFVEQLRFSRLEYLYKGFLITVLVIAAAAFQPEIRRALIRLGQPRFWVRSPQQFSQTVDSLVSAALSLSSSRTGALVVLERRVALGEFIETGVRMEGWVTAELLKTIFYPGTALHDMAVIIRGDRIVAARVQLPLAEAGGAEGVELGSRHRAAIGITSGSDAICVVVSEETGAISLGQNGQLRRMLSEAELRKQLSSALGETGAMRLGRRRRTKRTAPTDKVRPPEDGE